MYEPFFGLSRRPFSATPDPDCCAAVATIQTAFDELHRCMTRGEGIAILTGTAGSGKTLLCQKLTAELAGSLQPVYLANSNFPTRRSLLQAILYALGRPYLRLDEQELRLELTTVVHEVAAQAAGMLLVVDEAHLLDEALLEEIRAATNLVHRGRPLVRVMLSGQFELEEKLAAPGLEALNQRIGVHANLEPFSREESVDYIGFRLEWAGADVRETFTPDAVRMIAQVSDGVPRCLNQLADHSLLLAYVTEERPVGVASVRRALDDLRHLPLQWNISESMSSVDEPDESEVGSRPVPETRREEPSTAAIHRTLEPSFVEFGDAAVIEVGGCDMGSDSIAVEFQESVVEVDADIAEPAAPAIEEPARAAEPRGGKTRPAARAGHKSADRSLEIFDVSGTPSGQDGGVDRVGKHDDVAANAKPRAAIVANAQDEEVVVDRYAKLDAESPARSKVVPKLASKSPGVSPSAWPEVNDVKTERKQARRIQVRADGDASDRPARPVEDDIVAAIEKHLGELLQETSSSNQSAGNAIEYDIIQPEPRDAQPSDASHRSGAAGVVPPRSKSGAPREERYARLFSELRKRRIS